MTPNARIITGIVRRRLLLIGLLVVTTGLALMGALRVGVDNSVEIWFPDDDPSLERYHDFLDTFGNDEVVVIGVHSEDGVLTDEGLAKVRAVGEAAADVEGIARIRSIVTEPIVRGDLSSLEVAPIRDPHEAVALQGVDPLVDAMVSDDQRTALVLAEMEAMGDIDARRDGILADLRDAVAAVDGGASFAGIGVVYAALNQASTVDAALIIGASYLLILVLARLLLGRWRPVMLTLAVVGIGAVWLLGLYGASGRDINMVTMVMPTLVLVIGVSDCVHMLVHVAATPRELAPLERVKTGVGAVIWPCLFNTLTTAMGFLALASAPMPVIQDLGVFCALGLVAAFVVALLLCTLVAMSASFLPVVPVGGWVQRMVDAMARLAVQRPGRVLVVSGLVTALSIIGMARIEVDTYSIDFLFPDHPARVDSDRLEAEFGPYTPLEFVVHNEDGVRRPEILQAVAEWQDTMQADPRVGWTRSLADVVQNLHRVMSGEDEGIVPTEPENVDQIIFLFEADADANIDRFVDRTDTQLRVTVGVPMSSARVFGETITSLEEMADLPEGSRIEAAGYIPLYVQIMDHIVASQISSFAIAFVVIFVLIGLLFRSIRMAILAIPANLLPVCVTLGVMGAAGIRLDVATVTIAAIVLGLVVDDTTQFLYRYREMSERYEDVAEVVVQTIRSVGRPMLITTVILAGGFTVLALAAIKSVAYFGLLLATALVAAVLSDLIVVPALLVSLGRR